MICYKCGKNNPATSKKCSSCKAIMPEVTKCNGFADILSFKNENVQSNNIINNKNHNIAEVRDEDMKKLINQSYNIARRTKTNSLLELIAIGMCILIFISSVITGVVIIKNIRSFESDILTQLEETKNELSEYKIQLDELLIEHGISEDDVTDLKNNEDENDDATAEELTEDESQEENKIISDDVEE